MRTSVALRGTSRPQSPEDFIEYRCLVTGPQGTRGAVCQPSHKRRSSEARFHPEDTPPTASTCRHAQVRSTTIPLHQIGTSRTTPGILASDRNCFFPRAQLHEIKHFRGRHQIGGLRYFKCGWNAHFRVSQWYEPLVSSSEWSGGIKSDGRPSLHPAIPFWDADVTLSRHRPNSCCLRGRNRVARVAFCLHGGQRDHFFVHRLSVGQRRHSPPPPAWTAATGILWHCVAPWRLAPPPGHPKMDVGAHTPHHRGARPPPPGSLRPPPLN